ncbi:MULTISPECIES: hypothetical protein [Streptomyces]|uniref:Orn/Lys/Arg family decarboxylase n=1 Tax=Streptomyces TaxID=1883 RepID=UPI00359C34ED
MLPRDAFFGPVEQVPLEEAVGRVAAEPASPYPPGVPVTARASGSTGRSWSTWRPGWSTACTCRTPRTRSCAPCGWWPDERRRHMNHGHT